MKVKKVEEKFAKKFKRWVTDHPILKLIALLLAVIIWFYVSGEMIQVRF